jgi:hypothetical protein
VLNACRWPSWPRTIPYVDRWQEELRISTTAADRTVIAKIETVPLRIPFKGGSTSDASLWGHKLTAEDSLLVKVTTDTGMEGWGEAFGFGAVASAKLAVDDLSCGQSPVRFGLSSGS